MRKKVISMALAAIMCFSVLPCAVQAEESDLLVNESFDGYITNDMPSALNFTGNANSRIYENEPSNKVLYLSGYGEGNNLTFDTSEIGDNYVVSFDYDPGEGNMETKVIFSDSFTPVRFEGTTVYLSDGKKAGTVRSGKMNRIDIGYSASSHRLFVNINGLEAVSYWISVSTLGKMASVSFKTEFLETKGSYALLDNVNVYNGSEARDDFPVQSYNSETKEFTETEYTDDTGLGQIFMDNSFDDPDAGLGGLSVETKDNIVERREDSSSGNGYLYIEKTQSTDPLINTSFSTEVERFLVLEADFRIDKPGAENKRIFRMRDTNMAWSESFVIGANGEVTLYNNQMVSKLEVGKWTNLAICYDFRRRTFDFYVNKELVASKVSMQNQNFGTLGSMRITIDASSSAGDLLIDNMKIYESGEPVDIEGAGDEGSQDVSELKTKFPSDSVDEEKLQNTVALSQYTDYIFIKDHKEKLEAKPYVKNDRTLVPVRAVSEAFDVDVEWNQDTQEVTVGDNTKLKIGSNVMTVNGNDIELDVAPEIAGDGYTFLPLRALAENVLGQKVFYDDTSKLIVISPQDFAYAEDAETLSSYLSFDRYSASEYKQLYDESGIAGVHPRILANQSDFDRAAQLYNTDKYMKDWIDAQIAEASALLDEAPCDYYIPDGLRLLETSRTVLKRMLTLGFVYRITGDKKYAERAWTEMEHVGKYVDWNPKHFLDVGEMTAACAIGYDWCYDALTEEQRAYIEDKIVKFGFNAGASFYAGGPTGTDFTTARMNWNVVCNGGLMMGAMAIADAQPDKAFSQLSVGMRSLEYMMPEFIPSGAWEEGAGYWEYTMQYMAYLISSLKNTFGSDFHLSEYQGMSNTGRFYIYSILNTSVNNYHDASENLDMPDTMFYLANLFDDQGLTEAAMKVRIRKAGGGSVSGSALDCLWYTPFDENAEVDLPLDAYFQHTESASMRASWDDAQSMAAAFHGGNVTANHGHIDAGTYVLDMFGKRWAIDLGPEDYNAGDYFGAERNTYYRVRTEGHNLYVIDPDESAGQELDAFCPIVTTQSKERGAFQVMDLTSAYRNKADSASRGFMLTDDRRTFIVQDEIELKGTSDIYFFVHTRADVNIIDNKTAELTMNGDSMQVKIDSNVDGELTVEDAVPMSTSPNPTQNANAGVKKLQFKVHGSGNISVSMRFAPLNEYVAQQDYTMTPISEWQIPDGSITELTDADMIYADGTPIKNFDPKTKTYSLIVPYSYQGTPKITVDTAGKAEITEAADINGTTTIKIYTNDETNYYNTYSISFTQIPKQEDIGDFGRYDPVYVEASVVPEPANVPMNVLDGKFDTRWSGEGSQWIQLDLGEVKPIDGVALAYMNGSSRKYQFSIEVSEDGTNFTTVYAGETSATTDEYEIFNLERVNARYVRVCGTGNSDNKWNSVTEFGALYIK